MSIEIVSLAPDGAVREERRTIAYRVASRFASSLERLRIFVLLDGYDWWELKDASENRGMFRLANCAHICDEPHWPTHLIGEIAVFDMASRRFNSLCEGAIYLHDSTCVRPESLIMTLAHEFQHAVQYASNRVVWAYNTVISNLPTGLIETLGLAWKDVPIEREARIVAKRACEEICGRAATDRYIDGRIANGTTRRDITDWIFIKSVDTAEETGYDLSLATGDLLRSIESSRPALEAALEGLRVYPEFADVNLADGLRLR